MKTRRYAREYRQQMVELMRTRRTAEELAREFECSAQAIRNCVRQVDLDEGRGTDGLTTVERDELRRLRRLRRENLQLPEEREVLKRPRPGSPGRPVRCRGGLRTHDGEPGRSPGGDDVPGAGGLRGELGGVVVRNCGASVYPVLRPS